MGETLIPQFKYKREAHKKEEAIFPAAKFCQNRENRGYTG